MTGEKGEKNGKERRGSVRKINYAFTSSIIGLSIVIAGLVWTGSEKAMKAEEAHSFVRENIDLPGKVASIEKSLETIAKVARANAALPERMLQAERKLERLIGVPVDLAKIDGKFNAIMLKIGTISDSTKEIKSRIGKIEDKIADMKR